MMKYFLQVELKKSGNSWAALVLYNKNDPNDIENQKRKPFFSA